MDRDPSPEKHLGAAARSRRFDEGSRWGGRGGRTLLRARCAAQVHSAPGYLDTDVRIHRPRDDDGNVLVTEIDQELDDLPVDEGTGGRLFKLPEMLEARCVSKAVARDEHAPDVLITTFALPGVAWRAPGEEERRRLLARREAKLSLARWMGEGDAEACAADVIHEGGGFRVVSTRHGRVATRRQVHKYRIVCKFRDTPLERITHPSLLDFRARVPRKAVVFAEGCSNFHCSDEPLEVDLGANCRVTWISTQGRFPEIATTLQCGVRVVTDRVASYQWVTRYALSYRVDGGHDWICLAAGLQGNDDATTEVAHAVGGADGVVCRYLRFKPLEWNRSSPGMRVGVYGERPGAEADKAGEERIDDSLVRYSVYEVGGPINRRRVAGGTRAGGRLAAHCCMRKSCRCLRKPPPPVRRRMLRIGAAEDLRDAHGPDPVVPSEAAEEQDADEPVGPCRGTAAPWPVSFTCSLAEADLSNRTAASLGPPTPSTIGSGVVVADASPFDAAEETIDGQAWFVL
uniref:F5/8 type C domain-containing protein n=1 Tax=Zooxanthella nutricula TaxID=1333877 RepID=A0A7S2LCP7_9DINO